MEKAIVGKKVLSKYTIQKVIRWDPYSKLISVFPPPPILKRTVSKRNTIKKKYHSKKKKKTRKKSHK